jgi:hypothetical protein
MRLVAHNLGQQNVGDFARDADGGTRAGTPEQGRGRTRQMADDARGERDVPHTMQARLRVPTPSAILTATTTNLDRRC